MTLSPEQLAEALELAQSWAKCDLTLCDDERLRARALLQVHAELETLRTYVAACKEVATAKDVLWFQQENERMRAAFAKMVKRIENGESFSVRLSGCEWCGAMWPKLDEDSFDHVKERARRHAYTCPDHPLRIERDALAAERDDLRATVEDLRDRAQEHREARDNQDRDP